MKTTTKQASNSGAELPSNSSNQASTGTILQAYKMDHANQTVAQLASYSKTVTRSEDITKGDLGNWNTVRDKLGGIEAGGKANSKIAERANESLISLKLNNGKAMSAHMIPNRIGGAGGAVNVRPWDDGFEAGEWEDDVEATFNNAVVGVKGGSISYEVETTDMNAQAAQDLVDTSSEEDEKLVAKHVTNIQPIPLDVTATINGKEVLNTDTPYTNLVK